MPAGLILKSLIALLLVAPEVVEAPRVELPTILTHITVVPAPGEKIENGSILIVDGRIAAVGVDVPTPPGARVVDGAGLTAYAGFIDAFSRSGVTTPKPTAADERRIEDQFHSYAEDPRAAIEQANRNGIFARRRVEEVVDIQEDTFDGARRAGFTAALLAPPQAVMGGEAALVQLGDLPLRRSVLRSGVAQTASFAPPGRHAIRERGRWPATTFGVIAHWRQTMLDAQWFRELRDYRERQPDSQLDIPDDQDLARLERTLTGRTPVAWEADSQDEILRALNLSGEFGVRPLLVGARDAYKCLEQLKAAGAPLILSLQLPEKPRDFKLSAEALFGKEEDESRTLLPSKWNKRPFEPAAAYDAAKRQRDEELRNALAVEKAGLTWCLAGMNVKPADWLEQVRALIEAGLPEDVALRAMTISPARMFGAEAELGTIAVGKRANLTVLTAPLGDKRGKVRWVYIGGRQFESDAGKKDRKEKDKQGEDEPEEKQAATRPASAPAAASQPAPATRPQSAPASGPASRPAGALDDVLLHRPDWPLETDADRAPGFSTGGRVLLKNAYVITVSGEDLPSASILIEDGKIKALGQDLSAPPGITSIDLNGYVVMPGVIDPHSHIQLDSVNEWSQSITCEVRCADVVRSYDLDAYRALAGGCTTIHAMHGSANTIGGQCVLLKLKHGKTAAEMIIRDAPRTVKFATGENVTRSGRPRRMPEDCHCEPPVRRFPATRMGVETTMRRALSAGRRYATERAAAEQARRAGRPTPPVRRDLRLEALADILAGRIFVNCHCYRADEILRLLSVAEDFGIRIANLHHCLEAYRIMPEVLRHGAGTCTFSDWWAYKVEAYEAIPYNAGMLLRAGIGSTIKSDSADLMRHMPLEAAKCMKYSGLTPNEALRLITLNAARQFELEGRIGSIEVGKDADLAVYDGHPLDTYSKCVLTLIEGEPYFRHRDFDWRAPRPAGPINDFEPSAAVRGAAETHDVAAAAGVRPDLAAARRFERNPAGTYAITGGLLHPVSGPPIADGTLLIRGGRIAAIGRDVDVPADATVIHAAGRHVFPGLIDANTNLGLREIDMSDVTVDESECGTYQPDVVGASGFHPHSAMVRVARAEGVTTVHVAPGGPLVAGQSSLLDLSGWTMNEMLRNPALALVVRVPSGPVDPLLKQKKRTTFEGEQEEEEESAREEEVRLQQAELERFFRDAQLYARAARAATQDSGAVAPENDPRFDALTPYVLGERPVLFSAGSYKQILEALVFAEKLKLKPVILGGRDAWKCADLLAQRKVPVIYEGVFSQPAGVSNLDTVSEPWDVQYRALGLLERAGVKFCNTSPQAALAKLIGSDTGFAVAHGLSPAAALRAITLTPAEILGVADELGSLDVGKVANVVIATDHPCQATSRTDYVFIRGEPVALDTAHTENAQQFAERPLPVPAAPRQDLRGPRSQSRMPRSP